MNGILFYIPQYYLTFQLSLQTFFAPLRWIIVAVQCLESYNYKDIFDYLLCSGELRVKVYQTLYLKSAWIILSEGVQTEMDVGL